jgi:hypothetical protein
MFVVTIDDGVIGREWGPPGGGGGGVDNRGTGW